MNVITPAGTTNPDAGTRNPLLPSTKEMLDFLYPSATGSGIPQFYAPINQNSFVVDLGRMRLIRLRLWVRKACTIIGVQYDDAVEHVFS